MVSAPAGRGEDNRSARPSPPRRLLSGRAWLTVHGWLGLALNGFLLFVLVTGTIATVSHEIEWLLSDRVRADGPGAISGWGAVLETAQRARPDYAFGYIEAGPGPAFAWQVSGTRPDGAYRRIYVDPHAARLKGEASFLTFPSFMRQLHYQLLSSTSIALYAVCGLSFLLIGSLVSGLSLSKKFWRGFFRLRVGEGTRVFIGDLHRLCGLWSIWFTLIMIVTGLWYLVERAMYDAAGYSVERETPATAGELAPGPGSEPPRLLGVDAAVAAARRALPDLQLRAVALPHSPTEPYVVMGQSGAWLVRDRASSVAVDPVSGGILSVRRAEDMGPAERWAHTADPLHFGDFGGLASKLIWAGFGAIMSAMAASGLWIWIARAVHSRSRTAPSRRIGASAAGLRPWWWLNAAAMTVPFLFLPALLTGYTEGPRIMRTLGEARLGPLTATAMLAENDSGRVLLFRFCRGCFRQVRGATVEIASPGGGVVTRRLGGDPHRLMVPITGIPAGGTTVLLRADHWSGERSVARWPLAPVEPGR